MHLAERNWIRSLKLCRLIASNGRRWACRDEFGNDVSPGRKGRRVGERASWAANVTTSVRPQIKIDVMNKSSPTRGRFICAEALLSTRRQLPTTNFFLLLLLLLSWLLLLVLGRPYRVSCRSISGVKLKVMLKGRWLCTDKARSLQH